MSETVTMSETVPWLKQYHELNSIEWNNTMNKSVPRVKHTMTETVPWMKQDEEWNSSMNETVPWVKQYH
jgi:hypothetical protein